MKESSIKKPQAVRRSAAPTPAKASAFSLRSILVPVDFSDHSIGALRQAVSLATQYRAKLTLLHVLEPLLTPDFAAFPLVMENEKVQAVCKKKLAALIKDAGIPPLLIERVLVRNGHPYNEIANAARTLRVDLIVISTHGYTGLKHVLLGSTAERVIRHAKCPVWVVRAS